MKSVDCHNLRYFWQPLLGCACKYLKVLFDKVER